MKDGRDQGSAATKLRGDAAEARALAHLEAQGLRLLARNYRVALGPSRRAGEVDLVMQEADGTVVFVEVRARASTRAGGAAASIGAEKRRRIVRAARHWLQGLAREPACRFDVVAIDAGRLEWLRAAFDAEGCT